MEKCIVLVTNHLTNYRKFFYDKLHEACQKANIKFVVLLMTKCEPQRNWDYEQLKSSYTILMKDIHFSFPINNHLNIQVVSLLKEFKPDIVIVAGSYFYYTNWLVLLNKHRLKYPVYFWSETHFKEKTTHNKLQLRIREIFRKIIYQKFDGFWYSGKLSKEFIQYYAKKEARMYFVPNLIDNRFYQNKTMDSNFQKSFLKEKWNIPSCKKVLIIPARLSPEKGIVNFIELLSKAKVKDRTLILIPGTGPLKEVIEAKAKDLSIDIRLLGFQQQNEMLELYIMSDIFVLPSLSDSNPLTCIEGAWCGLPLLVSTHVGNNPEIVEEGINGYVFDYDKSQEALNKIEKIISADSGWLDRARSHSLLIAEEKYNPESTVARIISEMISDIK